MSNVYHGSGYASCAGSTSCRSHLSPRQGRDLLTCLRLMRLRFGLAVTDPASLPPYKGDLFRRALLWHLGTMWCRQAERCQNGCQAPQSCLFGRLLEPQVDAAWSEPIRRLMGRTPPPAYVLWDERDRRREVNAGDVLHFELTLIGEAAICQLPAFIAAVMVAGEQGIGRQRLRATLDQVDGLVGPDGQAHPLLIDSVWQGDTVEDMLTGYSDGQAWAEHHVSQFAQGSPVTHLQVHFLSPVKVKKQSQVSEQPDFQALARGVVRRLRILSEVHGAGEWPQSEYGPLLDLADEVQLEHHETMWAGTTRHSRRGGRMPLEGFVGQAWYASDADMRPLLPVLWLGQWVHVGKGVVWGFGRYEVKGVAG